MERSLGTALRAPCASCSEQLARFFPAAVAVRLPVQVTALLAGGSRLCERTAIEFSSADHAIFLSTLPLEFDDRVRLEHDSTGDAAEGMVIAVQYHEGRKAVAVRLLQGPRHWVTQP